MWYICTVEYYSAWIKEYSVTFDNMGEPGEHYADEINKPVTKRQNSAWFHLYKGSNSVSFIAKSKMTVWS